MVDLPWGRSSDADEDSDDDVDEYPNALVVCTFQDGTLVVYEDRVEIHRVDRSRFNDKTIPAEEIVGVDLANGITIGYIQIEQEAIAGGEKLPHVEIVRLGQFVDLFLDFRVNFDDHMQGEIECDLLDPLDQHWDGCLL